MKISNFSIKRPIFTLVTMFLVIILGVVSVSNIPLKLIPDIEPPVGVVMTSYQGASPKEVEEKVTKPLEESLSTLPGLKTMTSTSQEGANLILLQFSWSTDIDDIQMDVIQRIDQTILPDDVEKPRFLKFDPSQFPVIQLSLRSDEDPDILRELADQLKLELSKVDGVASVNLSGTTVKEVHIELDQDKLRKYGLSQSDVVNVIQANDISMPGDTVLTDGKELTTRIISTVDSLDTLRKLTVTVNPFNGDKIKVSDIGKVTLEKKDDRTITRTNQQPSVLVSVLQQSDANTAKVSKEFVKKLDELLKKEKYEGIESEILFDQGDFIKLSIGNITDSLILGGILAMVVLFFFLRNIKSPLIIGISIPYSVIVTFVLMYFSNFTLNIMTMGGLALGVGMLVDNAIVVIENIYRHLSMGKDPKEAAREGTKEVGMAITASTLTTIAVFLPVVFVSGIIGDLFTQFALTISFSLFASLIVTLTVVPMLASTFLKTPKGNIEEKRQNSSFLIGIDCSIRWVLKHRALVLIAMMILFVGGGYGLTTVGTQFLPNTDEGFFTMRVELENGAALPETEKVVASIEDELKERDEIKSYVSLVGTTQEGSFRGARYGNTAEIYVTMKDLSERDVSTFEMVDEIKGDIERSASKVNKSAEVTFNLHSSSGTSPNTLTFSVRDSNEKRLNESVGKIYDALKDLDDVTELSTDLSDKVEEIQLEVDREKALKHGLAPAQIATIVNDVTRGTHATQMVDKEGNIYGVYVEYDNKVTKNLDHLKGLLIKKPDGNYIELADVVKIEKGTAPVNVQRINQQPAVQFTLKFKSSTNLGDISKKVDEEIEELDLPAETEIVYSGDKELLDSAMDQMVLALALAIVLVYIVMAAQFESLIHPFVIMFTMPLMVIGVSIALVLTGTPVSLVAVIGLIILAGIVVNNGIVLVDYINQQKEKGIRTYDAIIISVKDRIRPVLMTALTTILGLVPLALGFGEGGEFNQPLAITIIGGLISSTFLTLFVVPVVYSLFDKDTRRLNKMYATPDGQLIPAYLLEERFEKTTEEKSPIKQENMDVPGIQTSKFSREDMVSMLEELLKLVKDENRPEKEDDNS